MGQMNAPLMELDQPTMQATINKFTPGTGLAWSTLFPLKYTRKFDLKGIEGEDGIPVSADRVSFNSKSKDKRRNKVGTWNATLGKIMISRSKDELEINEYNDAKTLAASNTEDAAAAQELVEMVYGDIAFCNNGMDYRTEIEALTIGSNGKRTFSTKFDGDMVEQEEINFNIPANHQIGATAAWSDATNADGLADIIRGAKIVASEGLRRPMYAILDQTAFDLLCAQKKVIKKVASAILKATGLDSEDDVNLEAINRYMRTKGAPQLLVLDSYVTVEDEDGNRHTEKPWNSNSVVLSPEPRLGYTYYKTVPMVQNTEALQAYGRYYKQTRYSEVNPMKEVTMAEAYIQPALTNRKSLVYLNCMSTSWNNGE